MSSSASSAGAGHSAAGTGAHSDDGAAVSSSAGAAPPLPPSLPPLLAGLPPLTDLPPEARKVTQYLPPALLPLLGAPLDSVFFALLLLPTVFAIDELGRTEWFVRSRCRLLADPVASAGYRCGQHSLTGLRRPAELTAAVLRAGPLVAPAAAPGAPPPPRRLLDTATVRVLFARKAKRLRGVMLPARNWETTRGLEERARLVECAVTEEVFMLVRAREVEGQAAAAAVRGVIRGATQSERGGGGCFKLLSHLSATPPLCSPPAEPGVAKIPARLPHPAATPPAGAGGPAQGAVAGQQCVALYGRPLARIPPRLQTRCNNTTAVRRSFLFIIRRRVELCVDATARRVRARPRGRRVHRAQHVLTSGRHHRAE